VTGIPPGRVFHLVTAADPAARLDSPILAEDQFQRHGFVHCCFREQLTEIASWWFDADDDLVALELDPSRLTHELRLEPSPTRWYPHLYGPIDLDAVVAIHDLPADAGVDRTALPPSLAAPPPGYQLTGAVDGQSSTVRWWLPGRIEGDERWTDEAKAAIAGGLTVELFGGIVVPATLERAHESFALLASVADGGRIDRYDGDGFFSF
jgi:uncharacterized protein (DUF952 family)